MSEESQRYNNSAVKKCQSCGADMVFDPVTGKLKCHFCDSIKDIIKRPSFLRNYEAEKYQGVIKAEGNKYKCPNCSGEIELSSFETATKCPYCGATNIIKFDDLKGMKPDSILPFLYSQENAASAGKKWIKKKILAPNKVRKSLDIKNFKGMYFPSFSFDVNTSTKYDGRFGERRTRTVGSGQNRHTETYIEWYLVKGTRNFHYQNVLVEASTQIEQKELKNILPYDMENAEAYNSDYLAGFDAERYDTPIENTYSIAKMQIDDDIRKAIINKYHPDEIDYLNIYTNYSDKKFRYVLLPLWICLYKFKEKMYRFIVNGRTGAATGKVPTSGAKLTAVILSILAIIAFVVCMIVFYGE